MPPRRTGRKRAPSKALLHLDAPKASKARKIAPVPKKPIVLSSGAEVSSPPVLSDVEDLPLLKLNPPKAPQTPQAVNVNAFTSRELVVFAAKSAAALIARRARVPSPAKLGWFGDEDEDEEDLDDN